MKKIFYIFILFCIDFSIKAQQGNEKIEALRADFIQKKISLSSTETTKFWPIYNEYNDKLKALRKNLRQANRKPIENLSDKECDELYLLDIQTKQAEAELYKSYRDKLKLIIGTKRMVLLHKAENEFKKEILKNIQDKSD